MKQVQVTRVESDASSGILEVTITVSRSQPGEVFVHSAPDADDLPRDIVDALSAWLNLREERMEILRHASEPE